MCARLASALYHLSEFSIDLQRRIILKLLNYLLVNDEPARILILYSFFRSLPIGRVLDISMDCVLAMNTEQYEWMLKPYDCSPMATPGSSRS